MASSSTEVKAAATPAPAAPVVIKSTKGLFDYDVIIAGGGAAGMNAALVLGRARRRVLLIDEGAPSNLPADKIGGLLGQPKTSPAELYAIGRQQLAELSTVTVRHATTVTAATHGGDHISVKAVAADNKEAILSYTSRRLLLAMGLNWGFNGDIPGVKEAWGKSIFHCPFCHAWELRDQPLAIIDNGPAAFHRSQLLLQWTNNIVLCTNGPSTVEEKGMARLIEAGIKLDTRPIAAIELQGEAGDRHVKAIQFSDGSAPLPRAGILMGSMPKPRASSSWVTALGVPMNDMGFIQVDKIGRTVIPLIWAIGDIVGTPSVAGAMGHGNIAGAMMTVDLMSNDWSMPFHAPPMFASALPIEQAHATPPPTAATPAVAQ